MIGSQNDVPKLWLPLWPLSKSESLDWPADTTPRLVPSAVSGSGLRGAKPATSDETTAVAGPPDGRWVAVARADGLIGLWDPTTRRSLRTLRGHKGPIAGLAASRDGQRLASAGFDQSIRVWDIDSGTETVRCPGHTGEVLAVAFGPDGRWLVSGGADHTVRIWDTTSGAELAVLEGHTGPVAAVAISPDGARIATGGFDRTARIWDSRSRDELLELTNGEVGVVRAVAFSPDGNAVAVGGTRGAMVFTRTPQMLPLLSPLAAQSPEITPPQLEPRPDPPQPPVKMPGLRVLPEPKPFAAPNLAPPPREISPWGKERSTHQRLLAVLTDTPARKWCEMTGKAAEGNARSLRRINPGTDFETNLEDERGSVTASIRTIARNDHQEGFP